MNRSLTHAWTLVAIALSWASAPASAATLVHASPAANLVYQLDCVSHRIKSCGNRDGYAALWQIRFHIDVAHDEGVAAWARLQPHPRDANHELVASRTDPVLLRTASFGIDSIDRFVARLPEFLDPADVSTAREVIQRVRPAFDDWWNDRAEGPLAAQVATLQKAFRSGDIEDELTVMHRFFGLAPTDDTALSIELVRRVAPSLTTSAESIGRYAIVEIGDEAATLHMPVVVHEYVHYLFRSMPAKRYAALHARMLGTDGAHRSLERVAAWNLFNEALATAIGNGRVARSITPEDFAWRSARRRGLYNDDDVDAAAKALLPLIDWMFEAGHSIDDPAFADAYVGALSHAMGARLRSCYESLQPSPMRASPMATGRSWRRSSRRSRRIIRCGAIAFTAAVRTSSDHGRNTQANSRALPSCLSSDAMMSWRCTVRRSSTSPASAFVSSRACRISSSA